MKTIYLLLAFVIAFHVFRAECQTNYSWVSDADLRYSKPVSRSEEGMPVGNGRMGTLVWTTPAALKFQINRVDIFANNSASNNFFERNTDYCGGAGFVDIDFSNFNDDVFSGQNFSQHLSCLDGVVTADGNGIQTNTLVWNEKDVMAIRVDDQRDFGSAVAACLRLLRPAVVRRGNHKAVSQISVRGERIILKQVFEEDDFYCSSAVAIGISGREARPLLDNESSIRLLAKPGKGSFTVFVSSAASFDRNTNVTDSALGSLEAGIAKGYDEIYKSNAAWWKNFWNKGYVRLHSADGEADFVGRNYAYYLYVMGSASRGSLPVKFNGMLWTTGGDARKWGSLFWGANQSCLYNALFPTGRLELMDPMFKMYSGMRKSAEKAASQQWGSKGIYIPETVGFDGLPELPENIAAEMRDLYLIRKPWSQRSDTFYSYAATKMPFFSRWNWKIDEGWSEGRWHFKYSDGAPFRPVTHIFSRGAKVAYQYWQRYEFTCDTTWLRKEAYPMIKGMAEFYRNFPNLKKESDGKYHIYKVNDNEAIWGAHNTVEEISSMMGILPVVIRASEILGVDKEMRPVWQELLDHLSPLPLSTNYPELQQPTTTWVKALQPVLHGEGFRKPDPNTMPVWFFDLCNQGGNPEMLKIANATFDGYFPEGINSGTRVNVLSKLPVAGTILGRTAATKYLIPNQIRTVETEVLPNWMDLREGYQTTSIQRLGRAADALHHALCQSAPPWPGEDPIIRIFPAWPSDWDAEFKLLCRGNFMVSSSFKSGKIEFVEITSLSGSPCKIVNPWPSGKAVVLYRNGKKFGLLKGQTFTILTKKDDVLKITPL